MDKKIIEYLKVHPTITTIDADKMIFELDNDVRIVRKTNEIRPQIDLAKYVERGYELTNPDYQDNMNEEDHKACYWIYYS